MSYCKETAAYVQCPLGHRCYIQNREARVLKEIAERPKREINLADFDIRHITVNIKGATPLIMHRFTPPGMTDVHVHWKHPLVISPEEQAERMLYKFNDGRIGFPADPFKKAMIRAAKQLGLLMTDVRTAFFVHGEYNEEDDRELVEIQGEPAMCEDLCRIHGKEDIRIRSQIPEWSATLHISYNAKIISLESIIKLLKTGGESIGVGEWRPEKNGTFGKFILNQNQGGL